MIANITYTRKSMCTLGLCLYNKAFAWFGFYPALYGLWRLARGRNLTLVEFLLWARMPTVLHTSSSLISKYNSDSNYIPHFTE